MLDKEAHDVRNETRYPMDYGQHQRIFFWDLGSAAVCFGAGNFCALFFLMYVSVAPAFCLWFLYDLAFLHHGLAFVSGSGFLLGGYLSDFCIHTPRYASRCLPYTVLRAARHYHCVSPGQEFVFRPLWSNNI